MGSSAKGLPERTINGPCANKYESYRGGISYRACPELLCVPSAKVVSTTLCDGCLAKYHLAAPLTAVCVLLYVLWVGACTEMLCDHKEVSVVGTDEQEHVVSIYTGTWY